MSDIASLNSRFAIPGAVSVVSSNGNLPAIHINKPGLCSGTIYLHGAHVTAWKPEGAEEVLWLSQKSGWQNDKPIRGGVPLCFPWFGPRNSTEYPNSPMHGFARTKPWSIESISESPTSITVSLSLQNDASTMALWPVPFMLRHRITFSRELIMSLEFTHAAKTPIPFEEAQHTYFAVGDIGRQRAASGGHRRQRGAAGAAHGDRDHRRRA